MATIDVALSGMTVSVALVQQVLPQVAAAFKPFGITLNFVAGTSFGSVDPVQAATFGTLTKQLLTNSAQNVPPSPAHLVATQTPPGYTYSLNGSMLDYMRGIAAVYTNASIYGPGGAASRLDILAQICIHELGHMLDLTHGDASGAYPNAMLPSSQRMVPGSPGPAWTAAAAEAHSYGEPAVPQPNPTNFYPFNAQCRSNLRAASNNSAWWPFQSPFRGTYQSGAEDSSRMLTMTLVAPEQMGEIARPGVLYVTLCISNETSEVLELPALIGPEFGSLRVEVTPEGDNPYWMQPTDEHCSEARTAILPGQQIFRSFALAGNPACPLFRKDGAHLVRLQLVDHQNPRASCVATTAFPVNVATAAETAISAKALTTVLDRRTSRSRATALLKNVSDPAAPMALHGQVHLARRARTSRDRDTLQGIAEDVEAPLVIRHAAAARTARRRIDQGADWRKVAEDYRAIFAAPVHDEFFETIERFGVGRSRMLALAGER